MTLRAQSSLFALLQVIEDKLQDKASEEKNLCEWWQDSGVDEAIGDILDA
jgi:hypothetical protein